MHIYIENNIPVESVYWIFERLTNKIMIMSRDLTFYFLELARKCVKYSIFSTKIYSIHIYAYNKYIFG